MGLADRGRPYWLIFLIEQNGLPPNGLAFLRDKGSKKKYRRGKIERLAVCLAREYSSVCKVWKYNGFFFFILSSIGKNFLRANARIFFIFFITIIACGHENLESLIRNYAFLSWNLMFGNQFFDIFLLYIYIYNCVNISGFLCC